MIFLLGKYGFIKQSYGSISLSILRFEVMSEKRPELSSALAPLMTPCLWTVSYSYSERL